MSNVQHKVYTLPKEQEVLEVLRKAGATRARLYGSAARGELTESSDIDLLIENPTDDYYYKLFRVQEELEELWGRKVDISYSVSPYFWEYIEPDLVELPF